MWDLTMSQWKCNKILQNLLDFSCFLLELLW